MHSIRINVTNSFIRLFVSILVPDCNLESHRLPHTLLVFHYLLRSPESHPKVLPFASPLRAGMDWGCGHCVPPGIAPIRPWTEAQEWEPEAAHRYIEPPKSRPKFQCAKSPFHKTHEPQKHRKES